MLDVTAILYAALSPLGYPCSEAPMKDVTEGPYIVWQPGEKRRGYASGEPVFERQRVDITLVLPDGQRWQELCDGVRQALLATGQAAWVTLEGVQYLPDVAKRSVQLVCSLWEGAVKP